MKTILQIELPWPSSDLSPNSRNRWKKIKAISEARKLVWALMAEQAPSLYVPAAVGPLTIYYHFYPPTARHYDLDGLISRLKAAQDSIFAYLGLDDNLIEILDARRCAVRKGGMVTVMISEVKL